MPFLLYRYLITETLAPFFASLLIMTSVLFLGKLIPILNVIFTLGIGFADFIRLSAYIAPNLFLFSIPMASMLGVILCFSRLVNDNEALALKAGGIGLTKMLPPVIIVALCTSLLTSYASTQLIPTGTIAMKKLFLQLAKEKIDRGMQKKKFSEGIKDVVVYIDKIDPNTNEWNGVYVSDSRDREHPLTIIASKGRLRAMLEEMMIILTLENGSIHRSKDETTLAIRFREYSLGLPLENPEASSSLASMGKKSLGQRALLARVKEVGADSEKGISYLIEFHKRLALPAGSFILTILGLPLALRSRPGQRPIGLPLGLFLFICFYVLLTAAKSFSESNILPVGLVMWTPNLLLGILTFYILWSADKEKSLGLIDWFLETLQRLISHLPFLGGGRS
ncbi:MAG: LptF/LptG family permease [Thermodesulfobacteriota bacterium]|nr:LptF/LptG family permease [Thermodesulfobacteriota bacterium]